MRTRTDPTTRPTRPDPRRWAVLALMGLALCVIVLNNSALNVALPSLMRDLDADLPTAQWIVDGYSVVFAGLLIPAGAWADRFGRKRLTLTALTVFGLTSAVAATATQAWQLVALRALLGAAAAFVMPGTLAVLLHTFPRGERALAISVWSGIAALGVAVGPVVGGLLVDGAGWAAVFLLNVVPVVLVVPAAAVLVRESADPAGRPTDLLGAALVVVAIGAFVYTAVELGATGSPAAVAAPAALALAAAVGVVLRQRRARHPLVDPGLLTDRRFAGAALGNMLLFFGLAGSMFVLTQRLQLQLGMSPVAAGLAVGPVALTVVAASLCSPAVTARAGPRATVAGGLLVVAAGLGVLALPGPGYPTILAGLVAMGVGFGIATPTVTAVLVSAVDHERAGAGSALSDTMQELGFALGIAVVGAVLHRVQLAAGDGAGSLAAALDAAGRAGDGAGAALAAFDRAASAAVLVAAAAALLGAVLAAVLLPRRSPAGARTP